ncbi:hypothetical protein [Streptomyces sp. CL12-4]|uniref:hypothetical protein n=1 Tax=Streptomyces sp. CL12-4 TaxID=2810306 RepID=UPI001EFB24BF|nr:hypothetical protein [Streptomyces sp. CL12-4]MCG8970362.1 hypothetical protein [Streptomyces sp. CL12-4]
MRLKCWETTDGFGADQVAILFRGETIFFDGDMGEGDEWDLDESREFTGSEKVWVKEHDSQDSDELIGSFWVADNNPGEQTVALTGDDSHYDLQYRVD